MRRRIAVVLELEEGEEGDGGGCRWEYGQRGSVNRFAFADEVGEEENTLDGRHLFGYGEFGRAAVTGVSLWKMKRKLMFRKEFF